MTTRITEGEGASAASLMQAITAKLAAHQETLARCRHGSIVWRRESNGTWSIELKPTL